MNELDLIQQNELPKLSKKQRDFVIFYEQGHIVSEAYKMAYDCEGMKPTSIYVESQRLLKNEKIKCWIDYINKNKADVLLETVKYNAVQAYNDFREGQKLALHYKDANGNPLISEFRKNTENLCKLSGLFSDSETNVNVGVGVQMNTIKVDDTELDFNIGEQVDD